MRNLKRVLSLALATVMLLGMMVIGAGAADEKKPLTDLDKIVNKEAVNLMVDLSIIEGKPDGSFDPTGIVDRATMAKLVCKALMANADESSFKGTSTPLTDVKGNWAEGFINYCYSLNIVAGVGENKFNPSGKVTVASAAKMLLVALGYDPAASKYENDAMWSVNIIRDAQKAGLLDGVTQKSTDELTRDNAAQMIYNTLNAKTVVPDFQYDMGVKYLKKYDADKTTLGYTTYGLVKVTATVTSVTAGKATLSSVNPALANSYVNNKLAATSDIVGKNVVIFVKGTMNTTGPVAVAASVEKLISSSIASGANVTMATVKGTGIANLGNALTTTHKDFVAAVEDAPASAANAAPTVTYYVNGTDNVSNVRYGNGVSDAAAGGYSSVPAVNATTDVSAIVAKKGVIIEFVDTDSNGKANVVKITDKTTAKLTADVATKVVDGKTQVKVPGVAPLNGFNTANTDKNVFGFDGLKKDDIVLFYTANGNYYVEKAATVSGQLTSVKNGTSLIIEGTTYKMSGLSGLNKTVNDVIAEGYNVAVTYYLDNGSNIILATAAEAAKSEYAIVTGWRNAGSFGDVSIEAKLLMADGTTETVHVSKLSETLTGALGTPIAETGDYSAPDAFGTASTPCAVPVGYTIDKDGNYRLSKVDATAIGGGVYHVLALTDAEIKNNVATFAPNANNSGASVDINGNANTSFLVKNNNKIDVYQGIAKAPNYTTGASGADGVVLMNKSGIAVMAYITSGTNNGVSSNVDRAYIIDNTSKTYYPAVTGSHDAYYEYAAIIAGEVTTVKVMEGSIAQNKITANTIYALTLNKDGLTTNVTASAGWQTGVKYLDGVIRVGANFYTYEDASKIYVIDGNTVVATAPADVAEDATASVYFVQKNATDTKVIKELYIVKNSVPLPTALTATSSDTSLTFTGTDLVAGPVVCSGAATGDKLTVTATGAAGTTTKITISGKGTEVVGSDALNGTAVNYVLVATDVANTVTVTVKTTETATGATQTQKYQIYMGA